MNASEGNAKAQEVWDRLDSLTRQFSDNVTDALDVPGIPMLMRVMAMAWVCHGAGNGLLLIGETDGAEAVSQIHKLELIPDIVTMLRLAADELEAAKPRM